MRIHGTARRMRYVNIPLCLMLLLPGSSLVAQDSFDFDAFMTNTEVLYYEGDYEGAIAELEGTALQADLSAFQQARVYELLAYCHHSLDDPDRTMTSLESVFRAQPDYALRQDWADEELAAKAKEARSAVDAELRLQAEKNAATNAENSSEPTVPETSEPSSGGAVVPAELESKKGGSKRVFYIAGGAAALVGLLILAGGGKKENNGISTVDTLPYPPGRPTGP